jgi:GAF domain-containing protein
MWQSREYARGVTAWWRRYHRRPGVQVVLAFAVGVAAFVLAALVSPPLRELDADAVFVLGIFILVSVLVAEIAARAGRRADASEQARGLLADEQAALRRVATLVASGVPPEEVFTAVTEEVGRLLPVGSAAMGRYEPDGMFTTVAAWSTGVTAFPVGKQWRPEGKNVMTIVFETGRPARIDDFADASGPVGVAAREAGYRSAVGTPVMVEGRLWGVMTAASPAEQPLPGDTEARLASFTELVGTAIANAESGAGLARLAAEQAGLRRVATLVAGGAHPEDVFAAVTDEVGQLLSVKHASLGRYEPDGTAFTVVAWSGTSGLLPPVGSRQILGGKNVSTLVFETGRPARLDDYADASGEVGVAAREDGVGSGVGTPVIVEGRLWGVMAAYSAVGQPLPADTETRLASFTELVATAIANAESRAGLAWLAEEQAALQRVATLVARAVPPEEVFAAVTKEVGQLLGTDLSGMGRYESGDTVTVVATWAAEGEVTSAHPMVPGPWPLEGGDLASMVSSTGRPVRIDSYDGIPGRIAAFVRDELGIQSSVASPIIVEGQLWGVLFLHSKQSQPLPRDTESRLTGFTELVATGIANTHARAEVGRLAEEQAALRRVATLVAREASPAEVFSAVTEELGRLLGADIAAMIRLEPNNKAIVVAGWAAEEGDQVPVPVGTLIPLEGSTVATEVLRTGRPARRDSPEDVSGPIAALVRRFGITSTVGTPIVVEGRLWGGMSVSSKHAEPLPPDTESRVAAFAELVGTAIANAEARTELAASRARVVATADETRRRLERNLHDGAQQRLVSLSLELRGAEATVGSERGDLGLELSRIGEGLDDVLDDLRKISRGLHPAILSEAGLKPALKALARRSAVPVELDVRVEARLPESVEVAAYYVVSEGLANAVKHANASFARIDVEAVQGNVRLSICDDGQGGADPARGSGLIGLKDRVEAQGGTISVVSPPDEGTKIYVSLPVGAAEEPVTSPDAVIGAPAGFGAS